MFFERQSDAIKLSEILILMQMRIWVSPDLGSQAKQS